MIKRAFKILLLGGSCVSGAAIAQTAPPPPESADQIAEIVVTAQKRSENLQRVPITITAVDGDSLTAVGVPNAAGLTAVVPGLIFNQIATGGTPFLRGVGQAAGSNGLEPTVAFYFDGVYFPSSGSTLMSLNNIQQVAVLKGPQGTLFGRNSTGGVIQVTTRTPGPEVEFKGDIGYGNYDTFQAHLYGAVPLSGKISTGLSISLSDQGQGWGRNIALNKEVFTNRDIAIQNKYVLGVGERTGVTVNLLYIDNKGYIGSTFGIFPGSLANDGVTRYISEYDVALGEDTESSSRQGLASITLDHDFDWAQLKVQTPGQIVRQDQAFVQNAIPFGRGRAIVIPVHNRNHTFTSEVQLQSTSENALKWIAGFYFLDDTSKTDTSVSLDQTLLNFQTARQRTRSYAVFGELSYSIAENTNITVGGRYTIDEKGLVAARRAPNGAVIATFAQAAATGGFPTEKTWKEPTYRIAVDHRINSDIMVFGSYNRGFKSGIFNLAAINNPPAEPETIDAFEIGAKTTLFDRRVRLNVSGFHYNYENMQLRTVLPPSSDFILYNAAKSRIKGIDVDFNVAVTGNLELKGGFEILDGVYTRFPNAPCTTPLPGGGNATTVCNLTGGRMSRAPKFTGNFGFSYALPLPRDRELKITFNDMYNSGFNWETDGRLKQDSYHSVSGSVQLDFSGGRYFARVWGANLANERIRGIGASNSSDIYSPGPPRTYGITIGCNCL